MFRKTIAPVITPELIHNHMLDSFRSAENPVMAVPYNKNIVWCRLKRLNTVEIEACGDFSLIQTSQDIINNKHRKLGINEMSEYSELQHNIVKAALIEPKYEELSNIIMKDIDLTESEIKEKLDKIKDLFYKLQQSEDVNDRKKMKSLQDEYAMIEMQYIYRLPPDFISFVFSFALSVDISDIGKITEDMLYNAAVMAKMNKNAPHDNLEGKFTARHKKDIDSRAWILYVNKQKEQQQNEQNVRHRPKRRRK